MHRILIVDDEPLVRRGIRRCVNWNELGIEMVAEASNGAEALSQIVIDAPDIVLLDINMPHMDGLEFAEIIKKRHPRTRVVIITGYPDFEYVQSALRIGVDEYILKPVTKEEIERIVAAQLEALAQSGENDLYRDARICEEELNGLLRKERRALEKVSAFANRKELLPGDPVTFVLIGEYLSRAAPWADMEELAQFAILNVAGEILLRHNAGIAFRTYKNEMAMVLTCPQTEVEPVLREVHNGIADFLELSVDVGISRRGPMRDLSVLAEEAAMALDCAFVLDDSPLLFFSDLALRKETCPVYPIQEEKELLDHMLFETPDEINARLDRFCERLKETVPSVHQAKLYLLRLVLKLANTAESLAGWTGIGEPLDAGGQDLSERIDSFATLQEAAQWIKTYCKNAYDYMHGMQSRSGQLFVTIRAYIEKNHSSSSLNLKKCSEDLFLSPNYISMILKKESGRTFVDYLNDYRIRRAATLLLAPGSRIYEVSEKVGFTHPTYFSSVFKKVMGMSPKQYKETAGS